MTRRKYHTRIKSIRQRAIRNLGNRGESNASKNVHPSPSYSNKSNSSSEVTFSSTDYPVQNSTLSEASNLNRSISKNQTICDSELPQGRRIVDIEYLFKQFQLLNKHDPFDCNASDMEFINEKRKGLISIFTLKCKMCNVEKHLATEDDSNKSNMNLNSAAVLSAITTGRGHTELIQEQAILNIPQMTYRQYTKYSDDDELSENIYSTMWETIEQAGKEELELARQSRNVDKDGNGLIAVIADGAWCKRSYKINYDASSGVACIIGARTKKILFLATRNKYCSICSRSESKNLTVAQHQCYKNWEGTSTAMESDIILEGFKKSEEMHKLKYIRLIGDGDSNVYKKLCSEKPYGIQNIIQKIECTNHLLRNYCGRLRELSKRRFSTKNKLVSPKLRKGFYYRGWKD